MDKQDLDLLLQARTSELQHEYENLVRSLDAAYEAVRAIGRDIAENRAEARRLFDTRLKLARGDDLEAVLRLCNGAAAAAAAAAAASDADYINDTTAVEARNGKAIARNKQNNKEQMPGMLRLYVQQGDANSATSSSPQQQQQQAHLDTQQQQQPRVVTVTSAVNESLPRLRPVKPTQSFDAASLLIEQLQRQSKQHQQHEQPHYSPVYVGDDHSYAVNEDDEHDDLAEHQLMLEEGLMVDANRRRSRENQAAGVDLSIVKTELPDTSMEEQNLLVDRQKKVVKPAKSPKIAGVLSKKTTPKLRKLLEVDVDDEIVRKRKQTRERMRRWRAKKKMEELNAKRPYEYKFVIAKTANS